MPNIIEFASTSHMAEKVADVMEAQLRSALLQNGRAVFAVSGGSTPRTLHEVLSTRDLNWQNVTTLLVDERWVPAHEDGSNEAFVLETLRQNKAAHVPIVGLYKPTPKPQDAVDAVRKDIERAAPQIDVLHLGMGLDGHTASWFPHAQGLTTALNSNQRVCAITANESAVTSAHTDRMTLTLSAVKAAKHITLMLTGADKRRVFTAALEDGPVEDLPVRAILRERPDLWVCWAP